MKAFLWGCILLLTVLGCKAQDSVLHRVILIGDAGEINSQQSSVIGNAAKQILANKTTVLYLGDNIYPSGIGLPGSPEEDKTKEILRSQYIPMRSGGASVYFIPGNHDWNKSRRDGLQKIKGQWDYLHRQNDSSLMMIPPNGCPDPVEINLTDSLTVIAFDSEWWIYKYEKDNGDANCSCKTKEEVLNKFEELVKKNKHKVILLASHHPFQTYGAHGGHFTLKDHLFPLTAANKNLYIPLPIVGSLYPLLRTVFASPQDMMHPSYRDMIRRIDSVFTGFPNLIHVSGHEHGLQLVKDDIRLQVVSGSGAKLTNTQKGKYSLFSDSAPGYVIADFLKGNSVSLNYYKYADGVVKPAFMFIKHYTIHY